MTLKDLFTYVGTPTGAKHMSDSAVDITSVRRARPNALSVVARVAQPPTFAFFQPFGPARPTRWRPVGPAPAAPGIGAPSDAQLHHHFRYVTARSLSRCPLAVVYAWIDGSVAAGSVRPDANAQYHPSTGPYHEIIPPTYHQNAHNPPSPTAAPAVHPIPSLVPQPCENQYYKM